MGNVLIACEESQRVCMAFRKMGHDAFSCDIVDPSGGHPEWHIKGDALLYLDRVFDNIRFVTMDGKIHSIFRWDLIIAHPPCTYLSMVATRAHSLKCTPIDKINDRTMKRIDAMQFFMNFVNADCARIAIENPKGIMNTAYRKPDQTIDPYMFAESVDDGENYVTKATCLWLKGLPLLIGNDLPKPNNLVLFGRHPSGKIATWEERLDRSGGAAKARSKTFPGIAQAMAEQWGVLI